jgi:phage terminase small subunit
MGRNAKAVALHVAQGNPNRLTKAEIERRKEAQVKLGKNDLRNIQPPDYVKLDIVAYKKWQSAMKNYKDAAKNGIEILTSSDVEVLAKYCITYSEYLSLIDRKRRVDEIDFVSLNDKLKNNVKGQKRKSMNELLRLDHIMKLETAINKKHDILIKLEDRLFLNPLAKIKNVPKREKEKQNNPMEDEYDI